MPVSHCPICYTELLAKQVTPCMECGSDEFELDHYKDHSYNEYETYFGIRLILCDFCDVDFGSYDPTHFGFAKGIKIGYEDFKFVREIKVKELNHDKYCPKCEHTLPFLKFIEQCRATNEGKN